MDGNASGAHVALVTPTASGKSLFYTPPVVSAAMAQYAKALYLFPTKALAQNQVAELAEVESRAFSRFYSDCDFR